MQDDEITIDHITAALKDAGPDELPIYIDALLERAGPENIRLLLGAGAGRVPPQDIEAERAVLGAMLQGGAQVAEMASESLTRGDFYHPAHGSIFEAMTALAQSGKPVDRITVAAELTRRSALDAAGGTEYLADLLGVVDGFGGTGGIDGMKEHAAIVADKSTLRGLIETSVQMSSLAYSESADAPAIAATAENAIFAVRDRDARSRKTWQDMPALIGRRLNALFQQHKAGPQGSVSVPTGLPELDRCITMKPGTYNLLCGRPSMGKTSLAICIGMNAARAGYKVGVFSQEMTDDDLTDELLSVESGIDGYKFERPWMMTDDELQRVSDSGAVLWKDRIEIDDTEDLSPSEIAARARRLRSRLGGLDLVIIDYLQLCRLDGRRAENRNTEVGDISRQLKAVGKRLRVPLLVLSQLSRAVEKRDNKRPMLSDLYESGNIEANADLVMGIYRPSYYAQKEEMETRATSAAAASDPRTRGDFWDRDDEMHHAETAATTGKDGYDPPEEVEIVVMKQRKGPTGIVKAGFIPHLRKFVSLEEHRQECPY